MFFFVFHITSFVCKLLKVAAAAARGEQMEGLYPWVKKIDL